MAYVHRSRILEIGQGVGLQADSIAALFRARTNIESIKKAIVSFRKSFIDSTTPTMLILDVDKDIVERIAAIESVDKNKLRSDILTNIDRVSTEVSSKDISNIINTAFSNLNSQIDAARANKRDHTYYRRAFIDFGKQLNDKLYKSAVIKLSDPENIGHPGKIVLFGKSFNSLRDAGTNRAINKALADNGLKTKVGDIAALGHTSASVAGALRINTPALYTRMLRLEAAGKLNENTLKNAESVFAKNVKIFVDTNITFDQKFSDTANIFFDIGGSVVVYMDPSVNSASGASEERAALDKIIKEDLLPDLATAIKSRFAYYKDQANNFKNSPTFSEYAVELLVATLENKKAKNYNISSSRKSKTTVSIPIIVSKNAKVKATKVAYKPPNIVSVPRSLFNLEAFLRSRINEQVAKNMGEGNATNLLNYRTGRFSDSVTIDRLSESRQGMISVFYSYMKYPYATFSSGGAQSRPASRDPKLLISKSIRELAAEVAVTRLRSVLA